MEIDELKALDKFYTKPEIAKMCIEMMDLNTFNEVIEPSAGNGAYSKQIPGILAYDLVPEDESIIQQDFFEFDSSHISGNCLVIGNPPYSSNMAVRFFNKAATFADTIAFIVPKSWKKESVQDKLDRNFHLVKSYDLPRYSFLLDGEDYDVPCVFQVWEKRCYLRPLSKKVNPAGFHFVKKNESPDIAVKRVGGSAGKAQCDTDVSENTHYFISLDNKSQIEWFLNVLNSQKWEFNNVVGPKSLSMKEFSVLLNRIAMFGSNVYRWFQETMRARIGISCTLWICNNPLYFLNENIDIAPQLDCSSK